jgi:hypothetical protein
MSTAFARVTQPLVAGPISIDATWLGGAEGLQRIAGGIVAIGLIASGILLVIAAAGFAWTRATGGTLLRRGREDFARGIAAALIGAACLGSLAAATGWGIGQVAHWQW